MFHISVNFVLFNNVFVKNAAYVDAIPRRRSNEEGDKDKKGLSKHRDDPWFPFLGAIFYQSNEENFGGINPEDNEVCRCNR